MALSFTLLHSTSPIFPDMSQESGTISTLSNLENQLADTMTVIQTLMANIWNLTQQVIHLTQNMALMQANQNLLHQSLNPLPAISLFHLHPNTNLYHHHLYLHWPRIMRYLYPLSPASENQRLRLPSPFLEKETTLNLSSMDAAYTMDKRTTQSLKIRTIQQGDRSADKHIQEFEKAALETGYKGYLLVVEFKYSLNSVLWNGTSFLYNQNLKRG